MKCIYWGTKDGGPHGVCPNACMRVKWLLGTVKYKNGKHLLEEVVGNTIFVYVEELEEAAYLLAHGFIEWLLNRHTRKYRLLINKFIEAFEQLQYKDKEKLINALTKLFIAN